jgi:hypothetical protein
MDTCRKAFCPDEGDHVCLCERSPGHDGKHLCPVCTVAWSLASETAA